MSILTEALGEERPVRAPRPAVDGGAAGPAEDLPETVIEPHSGWQALGLGELWRYRELLLFLVWRDLKVRYKQTVLGVAWAVFKPFVTTAVLSLFLGMMAGPQLTGNLGYPYSLYVFAGILPWTFFAAAVGSGSMSLDGNQHLVTKVYFPRLLIPLAEVGGNLTDLVIGLGLLAVLMLASGTFAGWAALWAPLTLLLLTAAALGTGALLAALTVTYRDFRHLVPFLMQLWMFATPAIYWPGGGFFGWRGQAVLPLNPAEGLIRNFRVALLGGEMDFYALAVSSAVSLALLVFGCYYFRRTERGFADVI